MPMPSSTASWQTRPRGNVVKLFYYGTANQDVMDGITDPELIEVLALKDPTVLDRTNFTPNLTAEQRDAWAEMWVDVKAS